MTYTTSREVVRCILREIGFCNVSEGVCKSVDTLIKRFLDVVMTTLLRNTSERTILYRHVEKAFADMNLGICRSTLHNHLSHGRFFIPTLMFRRLVCNHVRPHKRISSIAHVGIHHMTEYYILYMLVAVYETRSDEGSLLPDDLRIMRDDLRLREHHARKLNRSRAQAASAA